MYLLSAAREGNAESGHFLVVTDQKDVAGKCRVVPCLSLDSRNTCCDLRELVGGRRNQRQLTLFRQYQQQVLVRQQDELTMTEPSALPLALAVIQIDACEDAPVESEGMVLMNDEVVVVGLQPDRGPALPGGPSAGSVLNRDTLHADIGEIGAGTDQYIAISGQCWLHDAIG